MNDERPGIASIIAQIQDISIKDLTYILLEILHLLKSKGIRIALTQEMERIMLYKKPATLLAQATRLDGAQPIWTEAIANFPNPTLPLTSTKKPN